MFQIWISYIMIDSKDIIIYFKGAIVHSSQHILDFREVVCSDLH